MKRKSVVPTSGDALILLSALYASVSIAMNIFCMKALSWGTGTVFSDAGQTISWIVFLLSNVFAEVWGEEKSVRVITYSAFITFFLLVLGRLLVFVPTTPDYAEQASAFALVFSNGPRTIVSSITAFWTGGYVNVHIIAVLKKRYGRKDDGGKFFFRASFSSLVGQLLDNALFMVMAFAPIGLSPYEMLWKDIASAVIIGTVIEVVIESFFVPFITLPLSKKLIAMKEREEGR